MPYYHRLGEVPAKRHTVFTSEDGSRYHEELMGQQGFSSRSALLYHRHSPSATTAIEAIGPDLGNAAATPDLPVKPRHLRTAGLDPGEDPITGRQTLLANADLRIRWVRADSNSPLYRNATGDELIYLQSGRATLESVFGRLEVGPGDYVVIPAATTHRWLADTEIEALVIEASGHVDPPRHYLSPGGQFREQAPYCERDLRLPDELVHYDEEDVDVLVRTSGGMSRHTLAHHPFDVVGWDGQLHPWALNIDDFEPLVGSLHQPPPIHQTFEGPGFVVCSFVPRPFDFHLDAVKVPYHHANTDSDEVLFYSAGDFMSRAGSGIGVGSISYHPMGFVHGPQPGSHEASLGQPRTEEVAVMVDTFAPLGVTDTARAVSDPDYPLSWSAV